MHNRPELWVQLMDKLVTQLVSYLELQISARVEAVQLLTLGWQPAVQDYATFVHPHLKKMLELLGNDVVIYFGTKFSSAPSDATAFDVLAFDWRTLNAYLGTAGLQGGTVSDPIVLCADNTPLPTRQGSC